jgi:hypothetical protein
LGGSFSSTRQAIKQPTVDRINSSGTDVVFNVRFPDGPRFSGGSGCTGMYRGLKLWEAAVTEAGSLDPNEQLQAVA